VSFLNSCDFYFKGIPKTCALFSTRITLHLSSYSSSYTSGKRISSSRVSSYRTSSSLCLTIKSSIFSSEFLELFSGDSSSSVRTLLHVPLTLLPCQFFFCLQVYLISIFYCPHFQHTNIILDFISQSIYIPSNFFFIILPMSFPYIQLIKIFSILLH
jgi:hypothetical protein